MYAIRSYYAIKMAKDQSLSLNPTKISGLCGRLMCCLKFEHDNYESVKEEMPTVGKQVITSLGEGKVVGINAGSRTVVITSYSIHYTKLYEIGLDSCQSLLWLNIHIESNVRHASIRSEQIN